MKTTHFLLAVAFVGGAFFAGAAGGCQATAMANSTCDTDLDCADGQLCVNGACFDSRADGEVACLADGDCASDQICGASGLCETFSGGGACTVTADCPIDQYCNASMQDPVCLPLQAGACRESSQCSGEICSATSGGVGRCVECLRGTDCASGQCQPDGSCAEETNVGGLDAGTGSADTGSVDTGSGAGDGCVPACNSAAGETCVAGVCYGSNGCPLNAHPEGGSCVCDDGWTPNNLGTACEVDSGGGETDPCLINGLYGDGHCDDFCPQVDPDCGSSDACVPACAADETCYQGACYGSDGCPENSHAEGQNCVCDDGYQPDATGSYCELNGGGGADCPANAHLEADGYCYCNDGYQPDATGSTCEAVGGGGDDDVCAVNGWYGDGECDDFCPQTDPDCSGGSEDVCATYGYYGDGECDTFCAQPDPDCGGGGGTGDVCADYGYYSDGECDTFCAQPDPDCNSSGGDFCADYGWYGDGVCDYNCPSPDPDCSDGASDYCADYGWYGDGYCDDCPSPDPDCSGG